MDEDANGTAISSVHQHRRSLYDVILDAEPDLLGTSAPRRIQRLYNESLAPSGLLLTSGVREGDWHL